jgi:hypothetical protein
MENLADLQRLFDTMARELPTALPTIVGVEGKNFIQKNFRDQGFNDAGLTKWQERKTVDGNGRDITRYRTNRVGRVGNLNKYGSKNVDRAILVGFNTGGDKLMNSIHYRTTSNYGVVTFYTHKAYAERHNEGLDGMPKRQFMGRSKYLESRIFSKITRTLDQRLR